MKKLFLTMALAFTAMTAAPAQETEYPMVGAQIFIEPGQTRENIDRFFSTMEEEGMETGRIRMMGSHIMKEDGTSDFSLYDQAFESAERHGVRLFATLFPPTDELNDIGGFKFPSSRAHLEEIREYIRLVVSHFSDKPALYAWVLQNEPGLDGTEITQNDLSDSVRASFVKEYGSYRRDEGYLDADFSEDMFKVYYTSWYLRWIAAEVRKYDKVHYMHINPHAIFETLPQYDFKAYEEFLTSLGASIHPSWHFGYFTRDRYSLGVSVMSDIIRSGAGKNPFWITELQGGGVISSGRVLLCPTAAETRQWLWTGIGAGAEGVIFWSLNPRAAVKEAGEWGLLDYLGEPSDRMQAAADVIRTVKGHSEFFKGHRPAESGIAILYSREAIIAAKANELDTTVIEGRKASSVMKSAVSAYEAIASSGITADIMDIERFTPDAGKYPVAILPDMISLSSESINLMEEYVRSGGKLIVTGMTGYFDEYMRCRFVTGFPLRECFGGTVKEFKVREHLFDIAGADGKKPVLTGHVWMGTIHNDTGVPVSMCGDEVTGIRNSYGKGSVVWIPSMADLGSWISGDGRLAEFYRSECIDSINEDYPLYFNRPYRGILMRLLENGDETMAIVVNSNPGKETIRFCHPAGETEMIYGEGKVSRTSVTVPANDVVVFMFRKGQ